MKTKEFHITDVISITTGNMVSVRHMDGIYDILSFMYGTPIFTHQIPDAIRQCGPILLESFPMLADVKAEGVTEDTLPGWTAELEERFGKMLPVAALPESEGQPQGYWGVT